MSSGPVMDSEVESWDVSAGVEEAKRRPAVASPGERFRVLCACHVALCACKGVLDAWSGDCSLLRGVAAANYYWLTMQEDWRAGPLTCRDEKGCWFSRRLPVFIACPDHLRLLLGSIMDTGVQYQPRCSVQLKQ